MDQCMLKALNMSELELMHVFDGIKTGFTPHQKSIGFFSTEPSSTSATLDLLNTMETPTLFRTPTSEEIFFGMSNCQENVKSQMKSDPVSVKVMEMNIPSVTISAPTGHSHTIQQAQIFSLPQLHPSPTGSLYSKRQSIHSLQESTATLLNKLQAQTQPQSPCHSLGCCPPHNVSSATSRSTSPQQAANSDLSNYSWPGYPHCAVPNMYSSDCDKKCDQLAPTSSLHDSHPKKLAASVGVDGKSAKMSCKRFACALCECPRVFARLDELKRHMRSHDNVRPYECDLCNKSFTRSDHLRTHRRTHTGEKPFQCTTCGKGFARSDELSRHKKVHERGVRPPRRSKAPRSQQHPSTGSRREPETMELDGTSHSMFPLSDNLGQMGQHCRLPFPSSVAPLHFSTM